MSNVNRTVKKEDVEALARVIRKYAETGDKDFLCAKHEVSKKLAIQSFGQEYYQWSFEYLFLYVWNC